MNKFKYLCLGLPIVFSLCAGAREIKTIDKAALLGSGYNSYTEDFTQSCYTGNLVYAGGADGLLQEKSILNADQLKTKLNMKQGAKLSLEVMTAEGSTEFLATVEDDDLSSSSYFLYEASGKMAKYENVGLNATGQRILSQALNQPAGEQEDYFYERCGDEMVTGVKLGGSLIVTVSFKFSNRDIHTNFKAKAKVDLIDLISANAEVEADLKLYNKDISIYVVAKQKGGDPSKLGKIFSSAAPGATPSDPLKCNLENLAPCQALFHSIRTYLSADNYGFGTQLEELKYDPVSASGSSFLSYESTSVKKLGISELQVFEERNIVAFEMRQARQRVIKQYLKHTKDLNRLDYLLDDSIGLSAEQRQLLVSTKDVIETNRAAIKNAFDQCQRNLNACTEAEAKIKLTKYNPNVLKKEFDFYDYCILPDTKPVTKHTIDVILSKINLSENEKKKLNKEKSEDAGINAEAKLDCEFLYTHIIPSVVNLDLSEQGITDLSPLRGFKNLVRLDVSNNSVYRIKDFLSLNNLKFLKMANNRLTHLMDIGELSKIEYLDVSGNQIMNYDHINDLPNLKVLRTYGNDIDGDGLRATFRDQEGLKYLTKEIKVNNFIRTADELCQVERDWLYEIGKIDYREYFNRSRDNLVPEYSTPENADDSPILGWFVCRFAYKEIPFRGQWDTQLPKAPEEANLSW